MGSLLRAKLKARYLAVCCTYSLFAADLATMDRTGRMESEATQDKDRLNLPQRQMIPKEFPL